MAEQPQTSSAQTAQPQQPVDPFIKCKEITSKNADFYDIDTRFRTENVEKTAVNFEKRSFHGRAGKQYVFLAAHAALDSPNSEKATEKFIEFLKKAVQNYEKYLPEVIEKHKPAYKQIIDNLKFMLANPDAAFKAEVDILRKTGKIKTLGLQLAK